MKELNIVSFDFSFKRLGIYFQGHEIYFVNQEFLQKIFDYLKKYKVKCFISKGCDGSNSYVFLDEEPNEDVVWLFHDCFEEQYRLDSEMGLFI